MGKWSYTKFRANGRAFVWALSITCAVWMGWNALAWWVFPGLPAFDGAYFPLLVLGLSIEASIASSYIIAEQAEDSAKNAKILKYIVHIMETLLAIAKHIEANTKATMKDVDEIHDHLAD